MGLKIITEDSQSSPYAVPTGKRVLSYSFVGDTGGGTLTITNAEGQVSDDVALAQGEEYGAEYADGMVDKRIVLGGGASFAWTGIAHFAIEEFS